MRGGHWSKKQPTHEAGGNVDPSAPQYGPLTAVGGSAIEAVPISQDRSV